MLDWRVRILLFTNNLDKDRFKPNRFKIFRCGVSTLEVDLRFTDLDSGLEYISEVCDTGELCIFNRGEPLPLNSTEEIMKGINEGFHSMSEEKYWIGHEIFEDYWKHYKDDRSKFFHGIVLLCVSMVHFQMDHQTNAERIFGDARREIAHFVDGALSWKFSYPLSSSILNELREISHSLA